MPQRIKNALSSQTALSGPVRVEPRIADKIHALHQKIGVHFRNPPLEDEQIVRNGLVLTHISPSQDEMLDAMLIYRFANQIRSVIDSPKIFRTVRRDATQQFKENVLPWWWANTEILRSDFRARLTELKLKPGDAVKRLETQERPDPLKDILILPVTVNISHYVWLTDEALCNLTVSKIAGDMAVGGLSERLSMCARSDCRVFFLRKQLKGTRGGPPQKYCKPECLKIANQRDATERMRRSRAARKSK